LDSNDIFQERISDKDTAMSWSPESLAYTDSCVLNANYRQTPTVLELKLSMCDVCQGKRRVKAHFLCDLHHEVRKSFVKNPNINLTYCSVLVKDKTYF
jgi:hypothetical protein